MSEILPPLPFMTMMLVLFVLTGNPLFLLTAAFFSALLVRVVNEEIRFRDWWEAP